MNKLLPASLLLWFEFPPDPSGAGIIAGGLPSVNPLHAIFLRQRYRVVEAVHNESACSGASRYFYKTFLDLSRLLHILGEALRIVLLKASPPLKIFGIAQGLFIKVESFFQNRVHGLMGPVCQSFDPFTCSWGDFERDTWHWNHLLRSILFSIPAQAPSDNCMA